MKGAQTRFGVIAAVTGAAGLTASTASAEPATADLVRLPISPYDGTLTPYTFEIGYPTVNLRPGVRWHDGRPLTAADVVFTFRFVAARFQPRFTPQLARSTPPPAGRGRRPSSGRICRRRGGPSPVPAERRSACWRRSTTR